MQGLWGQTDPGSNTPSLSCSFCGFECVIESFLVCKTNINYPIDLL